jgi:hypothetical protein
LFKGRDDRSHKPEATPYNARKSNDNNSKLEDEFRVLFECTKLNDFENNLNSVGKKDLFDC